MTIRIRRHHVRAFVIGALATHGALWALIAPINALGVSLKPEGWAWLGAMWGTSIIAGFIRAFPARHIEFSLPESNTSVAIRFDDIFAQDGLIIIPVNEYFDGELGDHVSETSLHGQFIRNKLAGDSATFYSHTNAALAAVEPDDTVERTSGRTNRYAIGTVARVDLPDNRYLLAALSHTDPSTLKANASCQDLVTCLNGVWQASRNDSAGRRVNIPLIGDGLSGVGLPPKHLINILLTTLVYHNKEERIADHVTLILTRQVMKEVNLRDIKRRWS